MSLFSMAFTHSPTALRFCVFIFCYTGLSGYIGGTPTGPWGVRFGFGTVLSRGGSSQKTPVSRGFSCEPLATWSNRTQSTIADRQRKNARAALDPQRLVKRPVLICFIYCTYTVKACAARIMGFNSVHSILFIYAKWPQILLHCVR